MIKKLTVTFAYLFLFSMLALAGTEEAYSAMPFAIEFRQYATMAIVTIVCVIGGIVLFVKSGHIKPTRA